MNRIKKRIRRICFKIIDLLDNPQDDWKYDIQENDVYWAQMPLSTKELVKIAPGHRIRPYIVKEKKKDGIIAYACSSSPFSNIIIEKQVFISKNKYHLYKNSYVDITREYFIPWENIKEYYYTIDEEDKKQLDLKQNQKVIRNKEVGIGSLINHEQQMYIITGVEGTDFIAHKLNRQLEEMEGEGVSISFQANVYFLMLENPIKLESLTTYQILHQYDKEAMKLIKLKIREKRKEKKKKNKRVDNNIYFSYEPGSIFGYAVDEEFMYLFTRKNYLYGVFLEDEVLCLKKANQDYLREKIETNFSLLKEVLKELPLNKKDQFAINRIHNEYL